MFIHNSVPPANVNVINGPRGRFYVTPQGNKYPSITTVLGHGEKPWLNDWRNSLGAKKADKETKRAADRGSAVHDMAEKFLNNVDNPTSGHVTDHINEFNGIRLHLKKINNILTQETALYSDVLKVAGRVDCIGEWNGQLSVIDFKTSTNDKNSNMIQDYYLQTTAYALMFQEMYDIQIDNIVIIMSVERGAVPLIFKQRVDDYIEPLVERINKYYTSVK